MPHTVIVHIGLLLGKIGCGGCGETRHHSHPVENWQRPILPIGLAGVAHTGQAVGTFLVPSSL